eukprot:TRINITY_DN4888_c0_g1_i1.p1 TRINITY_DN4888_c0_g1~~TRINITY_DN4888_c0_g1_i1.p1  ORF type:complete len:137 (+),score=18.00 TRINITY_DN4888_c0_g1_i1:104-514(+)
MVKIIKPGKIVIVLSGKFAGHKAVVVRANQQGTKKKPFPHCVIAGVAKYPRKVTKKMPRVQVVKRSKVVPFIKTIHVAHMMPTRYGLDLDLTKIVTPQSLEIGHKYSGETTRKVRTLFEERYRTGKNRWFFTKLRF